MLCSTGVSLSLQAHELFQLLGYALLNHVAFPTKMMHPIHTFAARIFRIFSFFVYPC